MLPINWGAVSSHYFWKTLYGADGSGLRMGVHDSPFNSAIFVVLILSANFYSLYSYNFSA